jgi:predicted small lipoprotein YifL
MKNRISCFAVAVVLLALTLWFAACGSTTAEAEVEYY